MAQRVGQKVKLSSIDELLGVPSTEGTVDLDVMTIYPFENHPFRVVDDEKMDELVESIKESGVLTPVLVRPDDEGTYEMISGHRRLHAAKKAGLRKIPAIIKEMTNDDATIAMVNANMQREEILPSERAFAFKMKMDAIKHQGKELTGTLFLEETKSNSGDIVGKASGLNRTQVFRYIRLTELMPFAEDYFDSIVSVDSYHYFGCKEGVFAEKILPFVKENGYVMIAIPGLKEQPQGEIKQLFETWAEGDDSELFKTATWWENLLNKECGDCCRIDVKEAECYDIAWQEWFESGHEYGVRDKEFLDKGLYDILNFLLIYVRKGK
ncbi:ParB/RepB/Spo0J family partition protein [Butyrivibrio sp. INlla14]|uniref:ParB/RepB/Spo0J family partition protein n=1 Tax=Butyrivibrio sp. INlla14 TaxID=1520808 RepID=UPI000876DADD|nr:ParB/RepB/Spo0J family partition protein [Butyrivibrio sp. INlla14]SCY14988.1 ParB-like nuclease domain-containing protein [Butyrivibrio sp. INlla14]